MKWKDKLNALFPRRGLLVTATTGLKPDTDFLIAACCKTDDRFTMYANSDVPEEDLAKARDYHGIDRSLLMSRGHGMEQFEGELRSALDGVTWFTYNPKFQYSFLERFAPAAGLRLVSVPALSKVVDGGVMPYGVYTGKGLISYLEKQGMEPGFKRVCSSRGIDSAVPPGILPIAHSMASLAELLRQLEETEFTEEQPEEGKTSGFY